ncbi:zinc finger MYM-type protein 1-like [Hydra vulgaris]|uniref:Zinc finger MYM-type protein 1-like n=1 Tax=Hydra vulgaris TaxID=6087 RepID=A0ABM4C9A1_HYDVU
MRKQDTQPQLEIKETFLDHSAVGLTNQLLLLLENKGIDLKKCRGQGYDGANLMSEAVTICSKWKIKPTFKVKRQSKYARHFDNLSGSDLNECAEKRFQINAFYRTIDIVNVQISDRFTGMEKLSNLFNFLQPQNLTKLSEADLIKSAKLLQHSYPDDLTKHFPTQLINAITFIKNDITEATTLKDLADILLIKYSFVEYDFSDINTAILLLMTIPVTVASAERSFSKLKIIKSYLRNSMSQERLKHCAILAIENEKAQTLELDKVIAEFANKKARKVYI